ncbi:hypothetical protein GCM10023258_02170 [Terrabacter aeriphilus]|uniref:Secreted protein n=1 Tax=Terrabacter aeriphilus TaxID=515662 RepID=A0ABP9J0P6_9MICO
MLPTSWSKVCANQVTCSWVICVLGVLCVLWSVTLMVRVSPVVVGGACCVRASVVVRSGRVGSRSGILRGLRCHQPQGLAVNESVPLLPVHWTVT